MADRHQLRREAVEERWQAAEAIGRADADGYDLHKRRAEQLEEQADVEAAKAWEPPRAPEYDDSWLRKHFDEAKERP